MNVLPMQMRSLTYQGLDVAKAVLCYSRDRGNGAKYISNLFKPQLPLNLRPEALPDLLQGDHNVKNQAMQQHLCKSEGSTMIERSQGLAVSNLSMAHGLQSQTVYNHIVLNSGPKLEQCQT